MRDEKFTPGPWHVYDDGLIVDIFGEGGKRICGVDGFITDIRANASLVAAAPEMYELLKQLYSALASVPLLQAEIDKVLKKAQGAK